MATLAQQLQQLIDATVANKHAPGGGVIAFDKDGIIASAFAGVRELEKPDSKWSEKTVFWPVRLVQYVSTLNMQASMGKSGASIIAMSVANDVGVELDDHEGLVKFLPEFDPEKGPLAQQLVGWDRTGGEEKRKMVTKPFAKPPRVTLRMLLDHTYGMGYFFTDPFTSQTYYPEGEGAIPLLQGHISSYAVPPVNEPGTMYLYGNQSDWAQIFAVRASGKHLRQLAKEKLSDPLGLSPDELGAFITPGMEAEFAPICANVAPGTFVQTPVRLPQYEGHPPEGEAHLGSAPLYATFTGFVKLLQTFLSKDGNGLLPPKLFEQAIADSLAPRKISVPQHPMYHTTSPTASHSLDIYTQPTDGTYDLGWTVLQSCYERKPSTTGRSPGCLSWSGLANGHYLIDREKGVGLLVACQFLPFADTNIMKLRDDCEKALYASLK